ncbi:MAG: 1-phosphofructokinase family hexose kinase [Clostridia bacterium]|nr:1-phosphofructokinase family hexose kinase [Clostridia bacterium]
MNIVTLTLNPAFDVHCTVPHFAPYHENLARIDANEAGGKGVNISRALTVNGVENLCFVVLGEENGDSFAKRLQTDGMRYRALTVAGRIRENITVHTEGADETRISFPGFPTDESLLSLVEQELSEEIGESTMVTFTGRVPDGISMEAVKKFLRGLQKKGARIVIDSRSFSLDDLVEMKPWLIKPNQEEISAYLGREIKGFSEVASAARKLHEKGIENVMISLGAKGALLVCREGAWIATPPVVDAKSTIGAGDSSIGGFLAAAKDGTPADICLCRAVAYGSAACMTEGTRPPRKEDVASILPLIELKTV